MQVTVTVCDVCQSQGAETQRYEVKGPDNRVQLDLCEAHAQSLLGLMSVGRGTPGRKPAARPAEPKQRAPRGTSGRRRVVSMEEIEKLKVGTR